LLRELEPTARMRCESAHAALDLPMLAQRGADPSRQKIIMIAYFRFSNMAVSQQGGGKKKKTSGEPAQPQQREIIGAPGATSKMTLDAHLQILAVRNQAFWNSPSSTLAGPLPACVEARRRHLLLNIAMIRLLPFLIHWAIGLLPGELAINKPSPILQLHKSEAAPAANRWPSPVPGRGFS